MQVVLQMIEENNLLYMVFIQYLGNRRNHRTFM
jgi:hypothetical protein